MAGSIATDNKPPAARIDGQRRRCRERAWSQAGPALHDFPFPREFGQQWRARQHPGRKKHHGEFHAPHRGNRQRISRAGSVREKHREGIQAQPRSAGVPPAHGIRRSETVGKPGIFGSSFSAHCSRRAKRAPSWFGRAERAGGPRPDCIGNRQGTSPARRTGSFSEVLVRSCPSWF